MLYFCLENALILSFLLVTLRKGSVTQWTRTRSNGTIEHQNETEDNPDSKVMRDIYEIEPVSTSLNADHPDKNASGIYDVSDCSNKTNHAIVLIGWGTENGVDFWIAKNSWGNNCGESGYFRIIRGKKMCEINTIYYYPILTDATPFSKES